MNPDEIRKAVKPFVPGWIAYPEWWFGAFGMFQCFHSNGAQFQFSSNTLVNAEAISGLFTSVAAVELADGYYYTVNAPLRAGTYTFSLAYTKNNANGIFDLYVDSTKKNTTSLDCYALSPIYNNQWNVTGITITTSGWHTFKVLANGKNVSSLGYRFNGSACMIWRTA